MRTKRWILVAGLVLVAAVAGFLAGQALPSAADIAEKSKNNPMATPIPISEEISGEAREYCTSQGMQLKAIEDDPEACLRQYWTIDRLMRSERLQHDWDWDNGYYENHCGTMWNGATVCELIGTPDFPDEDDSWWDEQAVRDPGRTTMPGIGESVVKAYERERMRTITLSPVPIPAAEAELPLLVRNWCLRAPLDSIGGKATRAFTPEEMEIDVRPCLVDWLAR